MPCKKKNIKKIKEKKVQENLQIWIDFKAIYNPEKAKKISEGGSAPKHPRWGNLQCLPNPKLNLGHFARMRLAFTDP